MHALARRFVIAAALLTLVGATGAPAQDAVADASWIRQSEIHNSLLEIRFPGGRLNEYYDGLSRRLIERELPFNVVVNPQARFVEMPAFNARAMTAVDAIRMPELLLQGVDVTNTISGPIMIGDEEIDPPVTFVVAVDMAEAYVAQSPDQRQRVSADFAGGQVGAYIEELRRKAPKANIVVSERAAATRIGPITLRDAPLAAAVQAIDGRLQGGAIRVTTDRIDGEHLFAIDLAAPAEQTRVWSLAEHLQAGMNADDLLAGVEAAVGAAGDGGVIRFHAPTAMLIVRGSPQQIDAAGQAVSQMLEVGERQQDDSLSARSMINEIEAMLPHHVTEMRVAAKQVEVAQVRLREVVEAHDEGLAPRSAVAEAELHVVRAEAELEKIRGEITRLEARLVELRKRLDA